MYQEYKAAWQELTAPGAPFAIEEVEVNGATIRHLQIWEGFFDAIMREVTSPRDGWTGLWHEYHVGGGFNEVYLDSAPRETLAVLRALPLPVVSRQVVEIGTRRSRVPRL